MINCYFEDGKKAAGGLRHVTINALVLRDNTILLGKRGMTKGKKLNEWGKWGLLGGFLNRDETLFQAIQREVFEEGGCEINNLTLFRIKDNPGRPRDDRQNVEFIFIAYFVKQIQEHDEEVSELKWFPLNALPLPEKIAFDHGESIELYKNYMVKKHHSLPLLE